MYERDVPNIAGNVANPVPTETGANGAFCRPGQLRCYAPETAIVNYVEYEKSKEELFLHSQRIRQRYSGPAHRVPDKLLRKPAWLGRWIGSTVLFRPEIRLEHSYDRKAYDHGTKSTQFVAAGDLTYHF